MSALSFFEIVGLFAGSSVLAAIINQAISAFREHRKTNKEAAFSALYVAIALEDYASTSSSEISDSETFESSNGHAGQGHGNVPELPEFPASVEWKPFGIKATTSVLSFRVGVDNGRAMISDMWDFLDEDDVVPLVRQETARLGLDALGLAIGLRRSWGLSPVDYSSDWNVKSHLEGRQAHYNVRRREQEERNRQLNDELMKALPSAAEEPVQVPEVKS